MLQYIHGEFYSNGEKVSPQVGNTIILPTFSQVGISQNEHMEWERLVQRALLYYMLKAYYSAPYRGARCTFMVQAI